MAYNNKPSNRRPNQGPRKEKQCSCGARAKMKTRKNFPFGKKSKATVITFYKCQACGKKLN